MIRLPNIFLPDEFSWLLQRNISGNAQTLDEIYKLIISRPTLLNLILRGMSEFDDQKRIDYILKRLGWLAFRDHLCSMYIMHSFEGEFPTKTNPKLVTDILEFENDLEGSAISGYSRGYMLGLYLKLARIYLTKTSLEDDSELTIGQESIDIVKEFGLKVIRIDWYLLMIEHFVSFLGPTMVRECLSKEQRKFKSLYSKLNAEHRQLFDMNMLSYTYATRDKFLFEESIK